MTASKYLKTQDKNKLKSYAENFTKPQIFNTNT